MSELKVSSFGEVQALVNEFNVASANLQEVVAFTERLSGNMRANWEGAAIDNFMENYEEIKGALNKMVPVIEELKSVADRKLQALLAANQ